MKPNETLPMTYEIALILLRSGQLDPARYVELARENGWPNVLPK